MLRHKNILMLLYFLIISITSYGQFNLNINNGLPSNHVYNIVTDKYGYLWLATQKGVVRYNGYECKVFGISEGLTNEDVWRLYRDKKERIWLFNISSSFGYIQNNKYKSILAKEGKPIYPNQISEYNDGIIFTTRQEKGVYIEKNDSLHFIPGNSDNIYFMYENTIYSVKNDILKLYYFDGKTLQEKKECDYNSKFRRGKIVKSLAFRNYIFEFIFKGDSVTLFNMQDCSFRLFFVNNQQKQFSVMYTANNVISDKYAYIFFKNQINKLDSNLQEIDSFTITSLTNSAALSGYNIDFFYQDSLWGNCTATETNGAFITGNKMNKIRGCYAFDLTKYNFLGSLNPDVGYWYNAYSKNIVKISEKNKPLFIKNNLEYDLVKVKNYGNRYSILITQDNIYKMDNNTGKIALSGYQNQPIQYIKNIVVIDSNEFYIVDPIFFQKCIFKDDSIQKIIIDTIRYYHMAFDPYKKIICAYNGNTVLLYSHPLQKIILKTSLTHILGIKKIEKILWGKNGNIFILDNERLLLVNVNTFTSRQILKNYNFKNAKIDIRNDSLIVAGKFGVLFYPISNNSDTSHPITFYNVKGNNYSIVTDMQLFRSSVLINTDKGAFMINSPGDSSIKTSPLSYKLNITYNNNVIDINYNDTLAINQNDKRLQLDVVRYLGNGRLKYKYFIKESSVAWNELNANELNLPKLNAGEYYTLYIKVQDDIWISDPIAIHVYITPYWWQTPTGNRLIWFGSIVTLLLILTITVWITKKILDRNTAKKNRLLELELRSIYAQVNPHFIFNTLNSALYFIRIGKMGHAYNHILKFSKLLRAYIRSSRNRYITLSEEMKNLESYMILQQSRFDQAFDYEITWHNIPDATLIDIPSLLLQPLVENAINHGLIPLKAKGFLKLDFTFGKNEQQLLCTIDDNGIGRKKSKLTAQNSSIKRDAYGDILIKELTDIFNKYEKMNIKIEYADKEEPLSGTIVTVIINNLHYNG